MTFVPFDPLEFKNAKISEAALGAVKREIGNILSSYVGWYDPFCELIQNALDAVEARAATEKSAGVSGYSPRVHILIDLTENALTVTDNGIGLDKEKFEQFLAPNFSFKSGKTRGHKGVGATYVAYGFNYMRVSTKVPGFEASGRIVGARKWLRESGEGGNPKVEPDETMPNDPVYANVDRGVSVTVRFDDSTHPKQLNWIGADTAEKWDRILSVKTGLGAVIEDASIEVKITVKAASGKTELTKQGTRYLWLNIGASKKAKFRDLVAAADKAYAKHGSVAGKLPPKFTKLDFIYETWTSEELKKWLGSSLDADELAILEKHSPIVSVEFGYSAKLWTAFNDAQKLREGYKFLTSGIQLAANNMPQGEPIQVPLSRNIGRQNQVHFLIHFDDYSPDLGRKGFHRELTDFAKAVAGAITQTHLSKFRHTLKPNTGVAPDFVREIAISDWKKDMLAHEEVAPLNVASKHFFKPTERVSITSTPTREQDVIALFHQLLAGGVIRGIVVMSTNERFTYDGLFRVGFDLDPSLYVFDEEKNPLGVEADTVQALQGKVTDPKVLEYKFSLDGLIEDLDGQDKNIKDVDLCVVWETGGLFKERFGITTLLIPENSGQREYHGITHYLTDIESAVSISTS